MNDEERMPEEGIVAVPERKMIPLDQIDPNPWQPRKIFDEEELSNLVTCSEATDQVVTVGVYRYKDRYIVFDGERRVRAARKLGWKTIRADIHGVLTTFDPCDQTVLEMLEKADIANNQRSDITTMEKSRYIDFVFKNGVNEILESLNFLRFRVAPCP